MSSVFASTGPRSKRSYLTMAEFGADIFSYTTSYNSRTKQTTGTLTDFSSSDCPQGRFLYENGRKLYPGAHPGVETYMVGVFDPVSFISGYIDPNSKIFTPMNTDKPVDTAAAEGESGGVFGTNPNTSEGGETDLAQPVYTRGDILAEGNADISGSLTVGKQIRSSTLTTYTPSAAGSSPSSLILTPLLGQVHQVTIGGTAGGASGGVMKITASSTGSTGMVIYVIITNTASGGPDIDPGPGVIPDNRQIIDFDTQFKTKNVGVYTLTATSTNTFSFVSNGSYWYQIGETLVIGD